ncbi:MAG: chemotaxis protein CheX [Phycisphaerales bacterium]|jgi:chemotaxis protein CheX
MSIEASHINAFLESTQALFDTMIGLPVTFGTPKIKDSNQPYDISGIIGLSGDVVGSVVIGFDQDAAIKIVAEFTGEETAVDSPDFADAIGEVANMIAGGAKAKFDGMSVSIGCPSVITAPSHHISSPSAAASITIPCETTAGWFQIDISFRSVASGAGRAGADEQRTTLSDQARRA